MHIVKSDRPVRRSSPRFKGVAGFVALVILGSPGIASAHLFDALVFSKTAGFRHSSIPFGITMIQNLATANDFEVTFTEDSSVFTTANLAQYEVVIFLNTTGDVLDTNQQNAFKSYIESGKGFVGIHSAADTLHSWPWYGNLVGAFFVDHPAGTPAATVEVADRVHPSTSMLPKYWPRTDEWYNFDRNPRGTVHVLATVDEGTYSGGTMGFDHPIAWCQRYDGGRSWYTAGGHTDASYSEQSFKDHVLNGIKWAAGVIGGDASASVYANYQKVVLNSNVTEPMSLAVAPDNRVFFVERGGNFKIYKPTTQSTVLAGTLSVTTANEDGLLGIAIDPNFASNHWVYLIYSPASVVEQRVSRFTMFGDIMDLGSEVILLHIPTQRDECCHSAGSLAFGNNGQLYISTGDNTNPFDSSGYAPIDERAGRSAWDAQKSSSNRNDLRGKILRITPQANGTYTIPGGNLFPADGSNGRAEVYVMGCRNPFRISVDTETGWLYWGEVGPDAGSDSSSRGPKGYDEVNQARAAGNFGWPYCIANNLAYKDYNFATGVSGASFNCAAPINNSPNNTGSQSLPAAQSAWIWYPYDASTQFPEMNGGSGRTIMAGPVYHYNAAASSPVKIPAYYDDTLFIFEWSRNYIKEVKLDDNGNILKINPFAQTLALTQPIDMEFGPDGCMYMLEWNPAKLVRIEYVTTGNLAPVAVAAGTPDTGLAALNVSFSSAGSFDPDGTIISYEWDFTSDGSVDSTQANPSFTYAANGNYSAKLTVRDNIGSTGFANVPIVVGNNRPTVTILKPVNGGFYDWNTAVPYQVSVTDVQDGSTGAGTIPCSSVVLQTYIGHDTHAHPAGQFTGCAGSFTTASDQGHDPNENLYYLFEARYADLGGSGSASLTTIQQSILQPKRKQAENWTSANGVQVENCDDVGGGQDLGFIDGGDYVSFSPMNLLNISSVTCRVASPQTGGNIEVRVDSPTGTLISTVPVPVTGGWQTWTSSTAAITNPGGAHQLYFVFKPGAGGGPVMNVNWFEFNGDGVNAGNIVTYDLGSPDVANKMTHPQVSDGDTVSATIGGRLCKKNSVPANDFYFYFAVDDTYALNGDHPVQYVAIDYYDTGTGTLELQYDATSAAYKSGGTVTLTNTNTWKQKQWVVTDAWFGNRENNGADFRISTGGSTTRYIDLVSVSTNGSQGSQTPSPGAAFTVPGTIQAEQYDLGGQGVSYNDATPGNAGGQYRTDDVDIEAASDGGGGYDITSMDAGEWLEYTVNVTSAGAYNINLRVASPSAGGAYHIEMNGANVTGSKTVPNTGGAQTWSTTTASNVTLAVGQQIMRVYVEAGGWKLNYLDIQTLSQTPFGGAATTIPGTLQAENYDNGGEGLAYHDLSAGNSGGAYRSDNVDIEGTSDIGGGYDVGFIDTGEWLEYTLNVTLAGSYYMNVRVASPNTGGAYRLEINGTNVTGSKTVPNTGGWQTWTNSTTSNIALGTGQQILRVYIENGGWNLNYIDIQSVPGMAGVPSPSDGAVSVSTSATLAWTAGSNATSHDVYFGTTSPGTFRGNQAGVTYNPGPLSPATTYYWRIDEKNASGTTTGNIWTFTTGVPPGQASNPSPLAGTTGLVTTVPLSWTAGSNATSHDVYLGTTSPGTFQGNQPGTTYNPATLLPGSLYYWRIDEKNNSGTTTGPVWSFRTLSVPRADFDGDGDVDQGDYSHLQNCLNGTAQPTPFGCGDADLDGDGSVDVADFNAFLSCMGGANHAPGC